MALPLYYDIKSKAYSLGSCICSSSGMHRFAAGALPIHLEYPGCIWAILVHGVAESLGEGVTHLIKTMNLYGSHIETTKEVPQCTAHPIFDMVLESQWERLSLLHQLILHEFIIRVKRCFRYLIRKPKRKSNRKVDIACLLGSIWQYQDIPSTWSHNSSPQEACIIEVSLYRLAKLYHPIDILTKLLRHFMFSRRLIAMGTSPILSTSISSTYWRERLHATITTYLHARQHSKWKVQPVKRSTTKLRAWATVRFIYSGLDLEAQFNLRQGLFRIIITLRG